MKDKLDELDMQILKLLRRDSRLSYRKIAQKLNIATGTAQSRLHKLEQIGVIQGYHAHLDMRKIGYNVSAIIGLNVKKGEAKKLLKELSKHKNVLGAYDITGNFDAIIVVRFKEMEELDDFINKYLGKAPVVKTTTYMILDTLKETKTILE